MGTTSYRREERRSVHSSPGWGTLVEHDPWKLRIPEPRQRLEMTLTYARRADHDVYEHENIIYPFAFHPVHRKDVIETQEPRTAGEYLCIGICLGVFAIAYLPCKIMDLYLKNDECPTLDKIDL